MPSQNIPPRILEPAEQLKLEQAILPVVAAGIDGSFRPVGSCWIFCITPDQKFALAFSAVHVFDDVVRGEGIHQLHAASMPDILRATRPKPVSLKKTHLKAIYRSTLASAEVVDIVEVYYDGSSDLAVCLLAFPESRAVNLSFESKLWIHSGPVDVGTDVAAVGYAGMEHSTSSVVDDVLRAKLHKRLAVEHGVCRAYYGDGRRPGIKVGPCFEVDVATHHGVSGGPILHRGYGNHLVGCGVVSRATAYGGGETTTAAALWPFYSFSIPLLFDESGSVVSLIDLAARNWIGDKSDGPKHFRFSPQPGGGGSISWS